MQAISLNYVPSDQKYHVFEALLSKDWAMLLDSGTNGQTKIPNTSHKADQYRRYDICVCEPSVQLTYQQGQLDIKKTHQETKNYQQDGLSNPLLAMRQLLAEYKPKKAPIQRQTLNKWSIADLPFQGGWLGYISYDFGRYIATKKTEQPPSQSSLNYTSEHTSEHTSDSLLKTDSPLNVPLIRMGLFQWAIISDHQLKKTTLYNFGLTQSAWCQLIADILPLLQTDLSQQKSFESEASLTTPFQSNMTFQQYSAAFQKIQDYIIAGDCYQVNFAQRFNACFQGSPFALYRLLAKENNSPFSAYLNFGEQQVISLSPERFIECHQGKVMTQPIKGTLPRNADPIKDKKLAEQLLNSSKDKAENLMIVDLLRNDLSKTAAPSSVQVDELFALYPFESVHHLISTVSSTLDRSFDHFDLLATTLPGGSITGAPKIRAMQIIAELEPVARTIYCGIIGYMDFNGNMDSNICIRTLLTDKQTVYCWAGGGLVADSKLQSEYQETFDKLSKILPVLNKTLQKTKTL